MDAKPGDKPPPVSITPMQLITGLPWEGILTLKDPTSDKVLFSLFLT